jgi:formylglycine-generating enzyme
MSKLRAATGASLLLLLTGCGARTSLDAFGISGSGNGSGSGTAIASSGSLVTSGTTLSSGASIGVGAGVSSGTIAVASGFNASGSVFSGSFVSAGVESGVSSGAAESAGAFSSGTVSSSGTVLDFCLPGSRVCLGGNVVQVCSPNPLGPPTWGPPLACSPNTTCIAGECTGVCGPGQRNCIGNTTQTCDNGQWENDFECGGGTVCAGGVCIPETTTGACSTYCMTEPGCPPQFCYAVSANPVPAAGFDDIPDDKLLPPYAVDGNLATRYSSGQTQMGGEWFQVDLCQEKVVTGITVQDDDDPTDVAAAYTVQVSVDGKLWVTVAESAQPAPVDLVVSFLPIVARYVRYSQTGSTGNTPIAPWFSIDELNVQCAYISDAGSEVEIEGGIDEASFAASDGDAVDGGSDDATTGGSVFDATSGGVIDDAAIYGTLECTGNETCVSVPASCWSSGPGVSDCGPNGENCCTSYEVFGGNTYYRTYTSDSDGGATGLADPAFVSTFLLDKYDVTVGRFRPFVAAWNAGFRPLPGSGKHTHLNGGQGLVNVGPTGGFETGWLASDDGNVAPAQMSCGSATTWTSRVTAQDTLPMNCVNWYEAYAFCIWDSGGFLPSDAELEYAAAGGAQQREYPWGSAAPGATSLFAIYGCNFDPTSCYTVSAIAPVGTAAFGAGLWGQNDLAGNIWQWDLDYGAVPYVDPCVDCAFLTPTNERVVRGGDFESNLSALLSSSSDDAPPTDREVIYGFRCARSP